MAKAKKKQDVPGAKQVKDVTVKPVLPVKTQPELDDERIDKDPRRPVGRPTAYREEFCGLCIDFMALGNSFETFIGWLGFGDATVDGWVNKHPEFAAAKKLGQRLSRLYWEREGKAGLRRAGFNASVWIFAMKNRFGWRDALTISGDEQKPIAVAYDHTQRIHGSPQLSAADF